MHTADENAIKVGTIFKMINRQNIVSSGSGITVIVNGVHKMGGELFDEIAAAIIAIKMYIKSKNAKRKSRKVEKRANKKDFGNGKDALWFKSWLKEVMREFNFNPYRRNLIKNSFYGL